MPADSHDLAVYIDFENLALGFPKGGRFSFNFERVTDRLLEKGKIVEFAEAWESRVTQTVDELEVPFIDRETLVRNKRATGRLRDLADLEALGEESS